MGNVLFSASTVQAQTLGSVELTPYVGGVDYRWRDVADNLYSQIYRGAYTYSEAHVSADVYTSDTVFHGTLSATNLKPNFAYQLKLEGIPGTPANERIGFAGRWWQEEWSGSAWTNGQNLNDKGNGFSPSPNDITYSARRDIADPTSPTGLKYRYTGYLVFGYFITDKEGDASFSFQANSSYHVLWKTTQRGRSSQDGPLKETTFDPSPSDVAYDVDYSQSTVSVFGEWERLPVGGVFLQPGDYDCRILLTEESFHGSGGQYAGNWARAMDGSLSFTIQFGQPTMTVVGAYHGARLGWTDVGALSYNIYYNLANSPDTATQYATGVTGITYDVKNLPDTTWDKTCYYWVAPVGSGGEAPKSSWGMGSDKVWIYKVEVTSVTVTKQVAGDLQVHVEYRSRYLGPEGITVGVQIGEFLGPGTSSNVPNRLISITSTNPIALLSFMSTGTFNSESTTGEFVSGQSYKAWIFLWNQLPSDPGYWEPYTDKYELTPITIT